MILYLEDADWLSPRLGRLAHTDLFVICSCSSLLIFDRISFEVERCELLESLFLRLLSDLGKCDLFTFCEILGPWRMHFTKSATLRSWKMHFTKSGVAPMQRDRPGTRGDNSDPFSTTGLDPLHRGEDQHG